MFAFHCHATEQAAEQIIMTVWTLKRLLDVACGHMFFGGEEKWRGVVAVVGGAMLKEYILNVLWRAGRHNRQPSQNV